MEIKKISTLTNSKTRVVFKENDIEFFENTEDRNFQVGYLCKPITNNTLKKLPFVKEKISKEFKNTTTIFNISNIISSFWIKTNIYLTDY